eukprot:CAMPEP_0202971926 /NCGR_PEP_ID=MMETSP1396-20130829/32056_1 /ASSEMBLY_ACC=CAM_ASM_000872 /TAXON_ID= /ORGANISM="Pseudokeronopsis sp., Strain Brazil" /LENGTH=145 /DNA_ID=CAMNT_0049701821 /DNA_START=182 /DNA_END=618 /DNA_ORIENTATION=+
MSLFVEPKITVEKHPFEIHQSGWGEFEIGIKIYFVDPAEKPIEIVHFLTLYEKPGATQSQKKPILNEKYDEIVFFEPTEQFAYILDKGPVMKEVREERKDEEMQDLSRNKEGEGEGEEGKPSNKEEKSKPIDRIQYSQYYPDFSD